MASFSDSLVSLSCVLATRFNILMWHRMRTPFVRFTSTIIPEDVEHMGIGSEGYVVLKCGRKFVGIELNPSYFRVVRKNQGSILRERTQTTLDSLWEESSAQVQEEVGA